MEKNNPLKYILIGAASAVIIFLILVYLRPLLQADETAAKLVKDPFNWVLAAFCGAVSALTLWDKDHKA